MPRKSAASLAIRTTPASAASLQPRTEAPQEVSVVFREIVASVAPDHFRPADRPNLEELARSIVMCREAGRHIAKDGIISGGDVHPLVKVLQKQQGIAAMLSTRLRLTPQSRVSKDRAGATTASGAPTFDFSGMPR